MTSSLDILLDTTLRDGAMAVSSQLGADQAASIAAALESAGIEWIELGHAAGVGAGERLWKAAATDGEYFEAARARLSRARFGAIALAGTADPKAIANCAEQGGAFLRVCVELEELAEARELVACSKGLGLFTFVNLMKSHRLPAQRLGELAREAAGFGADAICVVDSAGTLLPQEVRRCVREVGRAAGLPVGFHGHDNLGLAAANSLAALEAGARWIDGTLCGVGRAGGNAKTEVLAFLLKRMGLVSSTLRPLDLVRAGEDLVRPWLKPPGGIDVVLGAAGLTPQPLPSAKEHSARNGVELFDLLLEIGKAGRAATSDEDVENLARSLRDKRLVS
ncbi:MAG: hypothetical protein HY549_00410 [Elusimicrobia bacterium]|nr:hypothetical protein [Elusimicrobiota bacterium]